MWNVDTGTQTASGGWEICPSTTGFGPNFFAVDLAPDGNYYGVGPANCSDPTLTWGMMNPNAVYGTAPTLIEPPANNVPFLCVTDSFACRYLPVRFINEVPDPGAPVGYRFEQREGTAGRTSNGSVTSNILDAYAVDSLIPYREHYLTTIGLPPRYNFNLGIAVSVAPGAGSQTSRTWASFITQDAVYSIPPAQLNSPLLQRVIQTVSLAGYRLSRRAVVWSAAQTDPLAQGPEFYIADPQAGAGIQTIFHYDSNGVTSFLPIGLTGNLVGGSYRPALPGGVHFEPDDTIYVDERGTTATKAVSLTYAPASNVTINFSISDPTLATVNPTSLTFTPSNWSTPQTITITGGIAGNFVLQTAPLSSSDPIYSGRIVRSFAGITQKGAGPTITPVTGIQVQQGSQLTTNVATVSDADDAPGSLNVSLEPVFHLATWSPPVNTNGTVSTTISVPCTAMAPWPNERWAVDVTDADGNTRSDVVSIAVALAGNPVISYANTTVTAGQTTIVSPATYDGSGTSVVTPSAGFTGSITMDPLTGKLTVSNANPPGSYTVNIGETSNCNATVVTNTSFTLDVNAPPAITPGSATVEQGAAPVTATLGTVNDLETPAGSLVVAPVVVPSGITIGAIANNNGTITAPISASCGAATGAQTVVLQVTDSGGASTDGNFTVTVTPKPPPTIGTYPAVALNAGGNAIATPNAAPTDDQSVVSVTAFAPGFTGSFSGNPTTGALTIGNAGPAGNYTVTVTATDDCGLTATSSFLLSVNAYPTISGGNATVAQGSTATVTLATVNDLETPAGSLVVATTSVPPGITVGAITNTNGAITAPVTASCGAISGSIGLQVTDGNGATTPGSATLTVTPAPPPTLGTYAATVLAPGGSATVTPTAAVAGATNMTVGTNGFAGSLSVSATGAVTIRNAAPAGQYTVTVTATGTCSTTTTRTFSLTVDQPSIAPASPTIAQGQTSTLTLATVGDLVQAASSLAVTLTSVSPGITVGTITNTNGTISAPVTASCAAASGTIGLQVSNSYGATATGSLTITITPHQPPTLGTYAATTINPGSGATITPGAPVAGIGTHATVAAPGFAGGIAVDATGTVTITNASPSGVFTVTTTVTDGCGATVTRSFSLTVNAPPSIAAVQAIALQQGSAPTVVTLATVSDPDDTPGSLSVTASPSPEITVGPVTNSSGTITAPMSAACTTPAGAYLVTLEVTDPLGAHAVAELHVNVIPNTPPALGGYGDIRVLTGGGGTVTPSAPVAGSTNMTVAAPGFTGVLTVDNSGTVTIASAGPDGTYTVTVTATNNCGATSSAQFTLTVVAPRHRAVQN